MKTVDLHVRPVYHWLPDRVRAHVFLCMLGYYLEWHMRQRLAPMLYDDDDKQAAEALRVSVVAKAQRSPAAVAKQTTGRAADGFPVHSFQTLLADLATIARNTVTTAIASDLPFTITTRPTPRDRPLQKKAFALLGEPPLAGTYHARSMTCVSAKKEAPSSGEPWVIVHAVFGLTQLTAPLEFLLPEPLSARACQASDDRASARRAAPCGPAADVRIARSRRGRHPGRSFVAAAFSTSASQPYCAGAPSRVAQASLVPNNIG